MSAVLDRRKLSLVLSRRNCSVLEMTWRSLVSAAACLAVVSAAVVTPKFKWSQDEGKLYIGIQAVCVAEGKTVDVTTSHFTFSCGTASGDTVELSFDFREPVDVSSVAPKCSSKGRALLVP